MHVHVPFSVTRAMILADIFFSTLQNPFYMSLNIDTTCAIYLVFVFKKIINRPSSAPWILHSIGEYYVAAKPFQHKLDPLHRQKFSYKSMYEDT